MKALLTFLLFISAAQAQVVTTTVGSGGLTAAAPGYGYGCTLSRSAATTVGISACSTADDTTFIVTPLQAAFTKTVGAWTVGTGNGCLDTGALGASTFIYLYQIQRADTGVVDYLCTITYGSPTMPTNYGRKRFIGAVPMDGAGNINVFTQVGNRVILSVGVVELNNLFVNTTTAVSLTLAGVPSGYKVLVKVRALLFNGGGANNIRYSSLDEADVAASSGFATITNTTVAISVAADFEVMTSIAQAIRYRIANATGTSNYLTTIGWTDPQIAWQH